MNLDDATLATMKAAGIVNIDTDTCQAPAVFFGQPQLVTIYFPSLSKPESEDDLEDSLVNEIVHDLRTGGLHIEEEVVEAIYLALTKR